MVAPGANEANPVVAQCARLATRCGAAQVVGGVARSRSPRLTKYRRDLRRAEEALIQAAINLANLSASIGVLASDEAPDPDEPDGEAPIDAEETEEKEGWPWKHWVEINCGGDMERVFVGEGTEL